MIARTWRGSASAIAQAMAVRIVHVGRSYVGTARDGTLLRVSPSNDEFWSGPAVSAPRVWPNLQIDDVLLVAPSGDIELLYRASWRHNFFLVTRRCDSLCVMCSQPPVDRDDAPRADTLREAIPLIPDGEGDIGITGGEPALLGHRLIGIIEDLRKYCPSRPVHLLSNGRLFRDASLAEAVGIARSADFMIGIPLYADHARLHDEVVGADGAFVETLQGFESLARAHVPLEVRVVLHSMSVPRLPQLARYIYRNLPFVRQVVFMGLEPTGWAVRNFSRLWVDWEELRLPLERAVDELRERGVSVSVYNIPLCHLPTSLWDVAAASISEWKNEFPAQCDSCSVRSQCGGFFSSMMSRAPERMLPRPILDLQA